MAVNDLSFLAGETMGASRWNAVFNEVATYATLQGTTTSASTAEVAVNIGLGGLPFYKYLSTSSVHVDLTCSFYSTIANTTIVFKVDVGGVYSTIITFTETQANIYRTVSGTAIVAAGASVGSTNVKVYFNRTAGTGTLTTDINCRLGFSLREVP